MIRRNWLPLAVLMLVMACPAVIWAADEVRDGAKFNNAASGYTGYVRGVVSGRVDSAVTVLPAVVLPMPMTVGGIVRADTSSKAFTFDASGNLFNQDSYRDRDLWLDVPLVMSAPGDTMSLPQVAANWRTDSTTTSIYTAPYGRVFLSIEVSPGASWAATTWVKLAILVKQGRGAAQDSTYMTFLPSHANVPDSTQFQYGNIGALGTAIAPHSSEFQVIVPMADGGNSGCVIELTDRFGMPYHGPYTSIRARFIGSSVAMGAAATAPWYKFTFRLLGRPF